MQDTITKPLLKWYGENKRVLPWREKKNPYEIWVSEIMLQQTRVEAVKPFYERRALFAAAGAAAEAAFVHVRLCYPRR